MTWLKQQVALLQSNLDKFKLKDSGAAKGLKKIREQQIQEAKVYVPEADLGEIIKRHGGARQKSRPKENDSAKKLRKRKQCMHLAMRKSQAMMRSPQQKPIHKRQNLGQRQPGGKRNTTKARHQRKKVLVRET